MLIEDMHRLPIGFEVHCTINSDLTIAGVVTVDPRGKKYIRWSDGAQSAPFGVAIEYDEYIASHIFCESM